jgi:hypothetical protein
MGIPVPYMPQFGTRRIGGGVVFPVDVANCHCTQCGAPHEAQASMCAYCLSPKAGQRQNEWNGYAFAAVTVELSAEQRIEAMVDVTTLDDAAPRYVPFYP